MINNNFIFDFNKAQNFYCNGNLFESSVILKSILVKDKTNIDSYDLLFKIAKVFNVDEIEKFIDLGKDIYCDNANVLFELSQYYLSKNHIEKALVNLQKSNKLQPLNIDIAISLSKIYLSSKKYNEAELILDKFYNQIYSNPELIDLFFKIYSYKQQFEKIDEIILHLKDISIKDNIKNTYNNIIKIQLQSYYLINLSLDSVLILSLLLKQTGNDNFYNVLKDVSNILLKKIQSLLLDFKFEYVFSKMKEIESFFPNIKNRLRNIVYNEYEIFNKKTELRTYPRVLEVTLTTNCNLKCKMCNSIKYEKWQLPERTKNEIIELLPYIERINWLGGEVFLYKDFEQLLDEAHKYNIQQIISTNGLLLNKKIIEKLLDADVDLSISVDGTTRDVYENIRIGGSFDKLLENINLINDLKTKIKTRSKIRMCSVVLEDNYGQIVDFVEFAHKYNFDYITITPETNYMETGIFNNKNDLLYKYNKTIELADKYDIEIENCLPKSPTNVEIKKNNQRRNINKNICVNKMEYHKNIMSIHNNHFVNDKLKNFCYSPWQKIFVDALGFVKVNCNCGGNLVIGDIEKNSIKEIWNNNKIKILREKMINGDIEDCCRNFCFDGSLLQSKLRIIY